MSEPITKHYVRYVIPAAFGADYIIKEIESRDQKIELISIAYGYQLFDRVELDANGEKLLGVERNHSPWHYKGEVYDIERVKREVQNNYSLLSNMRFNEWNRVLACAQGFIPLSDSDIVLED